MHSRKYTHSPANGIHSVATHYFTKEPHKGDNYFILFTSLALQRRKLAIFNPQMYKNRQHPTEAECRLFCCPILPSSCRFCSFLKLLSYRHTAKGLLLFCAPSGERLLSAQSAEGKCGVRAAAPRGDILFREREYPPLHPQENARGEPLDPRHWQSRS